MARRYRLEYRKRKREKERRKQLKIQEAEKRKNLKRKQESEKRILSETKTKEYSVLREILGWLVYIIVIIVATYLIITYVGQRTRVSGHSMEPTLQHGDNLIVDKLSYHFRDPERYEIIVFPFKYAEDTYYIKRIIGLPGDTIQVKDGYVYLNGEKLEESYDKIDIGKEGIAIKEITLGEDEYFVMGDNRNKSSDSRDSSVGVLKKDDFIGRAWIRIWPLDNVGVISHE